VVVMGMCVVNLPLMYRSHLRCPCCAILPNSLHAARCDGREGGGSGNGEDKEKKGVTATSCNGRE
jgi:hypothetical protein